MKSSPSYLPILTAITLSITFFSCASTEKNKFLAMMNQVSSIKNEIKAEVDICQEQGIVVDKDLQEKIDKSIGELLTKNHYKYKINLNNEAKIPDTISINTTKAVSNGMISIKAVINYPSTNYPVEINQDIILNGIKNDQKKTKKAYRIMISSLEPIQSESKINHIPGYKFMERSTETPFLVVDYDFKKAYGIINNSILEFKSTDLSLAPPDLSQMEVGSKYSRTFKSGNILLDVEFTLTGRDSMDDCMVTEQRADIKLTSSTGTHVYSLNNINGG